MTQVLASLAVGFTIAGIAAYTLSNLFTSALAVTGR